MSYRKTFRYIWHDVFQSPPVAPYKGARPADGHVLPSSYRRLTMVLPPSYRCHTARTYIYIKYVMHNLCKLCIPFKYVMQYLYSKYAILIMCNAKSINYVMHISIASCYTNTIMTQFTPKWGRCDLVEANRSGTTPVRRWWDDGNTRPSAGCGPL